METDREIFLQASYIDRTWLKSSDSTDRKMVLCLFRLVNLQVHDPYMMSHGVTWFAVFFFFFLGLQC